MAYAKFDPDKSDFLAAAIKYSGNIRALSQHYKINPDTMYQYLYRDPIGKEIMDTVRGLNTETQLDLAEHVFHFNLANYKENPAIAQRAAEFVLDKKGRNRGWEIQEDTIPPNQSNIDDMDEFIKLKARCAELEAIIANQQQASS